MGTIEAISWKPELLCNGVWTGNGLRYATDKEATASGEELMTHWLVPTECRAVPSGDPVNAVFNCRTDKGRMLA